MDAEAEVKIFERFREVTDDKIAIVISHRFSTVRMADQIIVLDRGRVVEVGRHDELIARPNGTYARLHQLQLLESRSDARDTNVESDMKQKSGIKRPLDSARGQQKAESSR